MTTASIGPLVLRRIAGEPHELDALQGLLEAAPRYFELVYGMLPGPAEAHSLLTALPPGKQYDDKHVWALYAGDAMIGCADVVRGWNTPSKAVIGLLLLGEPWQGCGTGRAYAQLVEQAIGAWPEIVTLRIGVARNNLRARAFWEKLGYVATGECKPPEPPLAQPIDVLEKPLIRALR